MPETARGREENHSDTDSLQEDKVMGLMQRRNTRAWEEQRAER